jgi:hypothetical protein
VPSPIDASSRVRLRAGRELAVINVSTTGALVEGTTRLLPGTHVDVHVTAAQGRVLVRARVVRCAVWTVTAEVIQYRGALAFTTPVDLPPGEVASQESPEASVVPPRPYQKQQRQGTDNLATESLQIRNRTARSASRTERAAPALV